MNKTKDFKILNDAEIFIGEVNKSMAVGTAHIAVTLAQIRRDRLFLTVSSSWKGYILQDRNNIGYENSKRLVKIGEIYLTFRDQLEEKGIKLSDNMSKMELFDEEIAAVDPVFYDKFKKLSYRALKKYIKDYKSGRYTSISNDSKNGMVTEKGASLYIGDLKVKGLNLNEARENVAEGKRAVVIWVNDDNEARRIRRKVER